MNQVKKFHITPSDCKFLEVVEASNMRAAGASRTAYIVAIVSPTLFLFEDDSAEVITASAWSLVDC